MTTRCYINGQNSELQVWVILRVLENMGARDLPDIYALWPVALGLWAYISGKSFMLMLQLLCTLCMLNGNLLHMYICMYVLMYFVINRFSYAM